jgi:hypothetical protein
MTPESQHILAELVDLNPDAVLFENMDCALTGLGYVGGEGPVAVYSRAKIYDKLLRDGFSREDADEYYVCKFLTVRAAELTPVIVDDLLEE